MKPRVRVKAVVRSLGNGVPADARPGDLVVGNRGAAAIVRQYWTSQRMYCGLTLEYAGNYYEGARPIPDGRVYDFS